MDPFSLSAYSPKFWSFISLSNFWKKKKYTEIYIMISCVSENYFNPCWHFTEKIFLDVKFHYIQIISSGILKKLFYCFLAQLCVSVITEILHLMNSSLFLILQPLVAIILLSLWIGVFYIPHINRIILNHHFMTGLCHLT